MIGNRIGGRYEILKTIGDGGMSRVYLAHDLSSIAMLPLKCSIMILQMKKN